MPINPHFQKDLKQQKLLDLKPQPILALQSPLQSQPIRQIWGLISQTHQLTRKALQSVDLPAIAAPLNHLFFAAFVDIDQRYVGKQLDLRQQSDPITP